MKILIKIPVLKLSNDKVVVVVVDAVISAVLLVRKVLNLQVGVDFAMKVLVWDVDTLLRLQIWDISGTQLGQFISYYKNFRLNTWHLYSSNQFEKCFLEDALQQRHRSIAFT